MPIVVRVPASSANLGAGFDTLGMALDLYAEAGWVDPSTSDRARLPPEAPVGAQLVDQHHPATLAFQALGGVGRLWLAAPLPAGRGLGYSGAVRVAGAVSAVVQRSLTRPAAAERATSGLGAVAGVLNDARDEVIDVCARLEGHVDNVAASVYGGVVATAGHHVVRIPLGLDPAVVMWIPSHSTATRASRIALPDTVPFADAVFNVSRAATMVAALAAGDVEALRHGTDDALHQPSRLAASPESAAALAAGLEAGAWCGWLSGSGPALAFLCPPSAATGLATSLPSSGHTKLARIDQLGVTVWVV